MIIGSSELGVPGANVLVTRPQTCMQSPHEAAWQRIVAGQSAVVESGDRSVARRENHAIVLPVSYSPSPVIAGLFAAFPNTFILWLTWVIVNNPGSGDVSPDLARVGK